ncbi:hypothetical protein ACV3R5_00105 [Clostridium perfringens]
MLNANKRDVKIKCRKFRNNGKATGVINRKNGDNISISVKISDLDKFLAKHGDHSDLEINLDGEVINTFNYRSSKRFISSQCYKYKFKRDIKLKIF